MDWLPTVITILSCFGFGGIVSGVIIKQFNKMDAKAQKREENLKKTEVLILKSIFAVGNLARANAIAIKNGKCNGETDGALKIYEECRKELDEHLINISTEYK